MPEKISCDLARDLMPLAIDGVCSEASRQAVDAHVAACPACEKAYDEMRAVSPFPARKIPRTGNFTKP